MFPMFIGGEACFSHLLFIGGVVSIFYRVELFCVSLIVYFLLTFVTLCLSYLCQFVTKRGRFRWNVGICVENTRMFCLGGVNIDFDVSNSGGELVCIFVDLLFLFFCHTCGYTFCLVFQEIYRLIQLSCCLHLQLMDSS